MKKLLSMFFALLLIFSLTLTLAACNLNFGGGGDDDGDDDGEGGLEIEGGGSSEGGALDADGWAALFDIDNVTVNAVMSANGESEPAVFKIYDGKAYIDGDEYGEVSGVIAMFDFSSDFSNFNVKKNVYFTDEGVTLATHFHDVEYHCTGVKVKLDKNGKIAEITYDAEVEAESGVESASFTFTLFNYGKTTADSTTETPEGGNGGSSSEGGSSSPDYENAAAWSSAFDFSNVTVNAKCGSDSTDATAAYSIYIVNGNLYVEQNGSVENETENGDADVWLSAIDFKDDFLSFREVSEGCYESDLLLKQVGAETKSLANVRIVFDLSNGMKLAEMSFFVNSNPQSHSYFEFEFTSYGTTEAPDLGGNEGNNPTPPDGGNEGGSSSEGGNEGNNPTPPEGGNDGIDLSESEWRALFDNIGNNVTVTMLCVNGADPDEFDLMIFKLVDGVEYLSHDGVEFVESSSFEYYVDFYDFSEYYSYISVDEGIYYADKFPMQNSNYTYYKDLVVVAEGGILDVVSYAITYFCDNGNIENVPESDWKYVSVAFSDYGTTEAPDLGGNGGNEGDNPTPPDINVTDEMDLSENEWRALFDGIGGNVTVSLYLTYGANSEAVEYRVFKLVDGVQYISTNGSEFVEQNVFEFYAQYYDFSEYYSFFGGIDGVYYAEKFPMKDTDSNYYKDIVVVDEDGALSYISLGLTYFCADGNVENIPESEWTYVTVMFSDYGTTEAPDLGGNEGSDGAVTEDEWRAAFDFTNVTVQGAAYMGTQTQTSVLKFSGDKVYVGYNGEEPTDGGSPLNYTPTFDFSVYYNEFTFDDGIYYADRFTLYQSVDVYEMYITLNEDGMLASLSYYLDYQNAGYFEAMMYYEFTFFDYGETVLVEGEELEVRLWFLPGNYFKGSDFSEYGECFFGGEDSFYSSVYGYEPWEPGKTRVMYFSIYNTSPLVLNFAPYFDLFKTESNLGECIQYQVISNAEYGDNVTVTDGKYVSYGENALELDAVTIDPYTEYFFALVIKMDVSAGNEYMNGEIYFNFDVRFSTVDKEEDELGPDYDA